MATSTSLWELWSEIAQESDSLSDPILLEIFSAGNSHRVFDKISDEDLKSVLSKVKGLLNEPKSREKGAWIFKELVGCVDVKRLGGLQDTLLTALRLICSDKFLHSQIIQEALANFLPKCKNLPDILKEVTPKGGFVTKIVASCLEELQTVEGKEEMKQPSREVLTLLEVCLVNFRGTCGYYRDKLERALVIYLDHDNAELVHLICDILPLISQTGGGGTSGDNHSQDWLGMVKKLSKEAYDCLYLLYSDCSAIDDENPFEESSSSTLEPLLPPITSAKIFVKISKIKKRLLNLLQAIGAYLRKSFPSYKPVPARNLLKLISHLISVNPTELLASQKNQTSRKELLFLAALLPSVHSSAFKLLNDIVMCLGTNVLPQAVSVEQLFSQQWRWMDNSRNSFVDLKLSMYSSLSHWLNMTRGQVTNVKTLKIWMDYFIREVELEKEKIELRMWSGKSKNKLHTKAPPTPTGIVVSCDGLNANNAFLQKNAKVCHVSLIILMKLLPASDPEMHKNLYCTLVRTHVQIYQQGTFPGQYEDKNCRIKLNESLVELALNPNARSSISLGLIINLLRRASLDSVSKVSELCISSISMLERLVHPSSQSLEFPLHLVDASTYSSNVDRSSIVLNNLLKNNQTEETDIVVERDRHVENVDSVDTGCQTGEENSIESEEDEDDEELASTKVDSTYPALTEIMSELKRLGDKVDKIGGTNNEHRFSVPIAHMQQYTISSSSSSSHASQQNNNFGHQSSIKRRVLDENDDDCIIITNGGDENELQIRKKLKSTESSTPTSSQDEQSTAPMYIVIEEQNGTVETSELVDMFSDFVDDTPIELLNR